MSAGAEKQRRINPKLFYCFSLRRRFWTALLWTNYEPDGTGLRKV